MSRQWSRRGQRQFDPRELAAWWSFVFDLRSRVFGRLGAPETLDGVFEVTADCNGPRALLGLERLVSAKMNRDMWTLEYPAPSDDRRQAWEVKAHLRATRCLTCLGRGKLRKPRRICHECLGTGEEGTLPVLSPSRSHMGDTFEALLQDDR